MSVDIIMGIVIIIFGLCLNIKDKGRHFLLISFFTVVLGLYIIGVSV